MCASICQLHGQLLPGYVCYTMMVTDVAVIAGLGEAPLEDCRCVFFCKEYNSS